MSYIEETSKHIGKINKAASKATKKAREKALNNGTYVTYLEGDKIIKEYPSGRKITLKTIAESSISVSKDGTLRIPQR